MLKVVKNYGKYAIVKDTDWEKWFIVDIENSQTIYGSYYLKGLKWDAEALESGAKTLESFESKWNSDYKNPIDMPKSLKAKQAQMQKQAAAQVADDKIPDGSTVKKIIKSGEKFAIIEDEFGGFYTIELSTGRAVASDVGDAEWLKSQFDSFESGAIPKSKYKKAIEYDMDFTGQLPPSLDGGPSKPIGSKAPSIVEVTDKGAYKLVKFDDGKYGYFIPSTGQSKLNLANKKYTAQSAKKAVKKHAAEILAGQGVDAGADAVDTLISLYEGRVREMYGQAYREMAEKQAKFMERFHAQQSEMIAKLDAGEITQEQLRSWYVTQSAVSTANTQMVNTLANDLHEADKRAMQMLNGYMMPAYAENFDFATFQIEQAANISTSFSLYNRNAIAEILKDQDSPLLPTVDDAADMAWCRRKISSCIAQSILQGESVPNAAKRLQSVVGMGANSAVRAARTALTGAQNLGRMDAGRRAKAMGIELKKQWVATADARTRHSHRAIDRETVELEEKFSNGCDCPGDPTARGEEVWNCRCAMRYVLPGHEYDDIPDKTREGEDYEKWKNAKKLDEQAKKDKLQAEIDAIEAQKSDLLKTLPDDESFAANEILKHQTSLSKWEHEQSAIADSKAYCEKKLSNAKSLGDGSAYFASQVKHYEAKLAAIEEYDAKGKAYHDAKAAVQGQLDALDARKKELGAELAKLNQAPGGGGPFSAERLAAGRRFATKQDADDALREISGRAWREATMAERRAINTYTGGDYTDYNMPLNGFDGSYRNYVGVGNVDIDRNGRGQEIRDMTRIIERSRLEEDMWVRRGVSGRTMATFFDLPAGTDLSAMTQAELDAFVGTSNRMGSFQSCGTMAGTGFSGGVDLDIFLPQGTEAFYAEPISKFGGGDKLNWDGKSKQSSFGSEFETIIQRGASYTCTGIEKRGYGDLTIKLEVHPEDGYWKFQQ